MRLTPPKWADGLLQWYCDPDMLEDIQGDLYELYYQRTSHWGKGYADFKFVWEVLRMVRIPLLKNPFIKNKKLYMLVENDQANSGCFVKVVPLQRWNDIVFESRNKDYGAYPMRNAYGNSMLIAFSVVFLLSLSIVLWWWIQFRH
jgi:hypothetical protein